jgi:Transposase DDE domain
MAQGAKEILGQREIDVVADMGYYSHEEFQNCEAAEIKAYVAKPLNSKNTAHGLFGKEKFVYEPESDCYVCPNQQRLTFRFQSRESKNKKFRYYWTVACLSCPIKARCTTNKQFRRIKRWEHEAIAERVQQRVLVNPLVMKLRQQIVEHPFGTMKFWNDQRHFLMKGLAQVRAEFSLSTLAYNLKRAVNIVGVQGLLTALP